jgi:hypothetical protein
MASRVGFVFSGIDGEVSDEGKGLASFLSAFVGTATAAGEAELHDLEKLRLRHQQSIGFVFQRAWVERACRG